jgi:Phytanoyl-CoA dioxygenase (PhyH)
MIVCRKAPTGRIAGAPLAVPPKGLSQGSQRVGACVRASAARKSLMAVARYLLFPWWVAQIATGAKAFSDNPVLGSGHLNRLGLHAARVRIAATLAASRRKRLSHLISGTDRIAFERDGFVLRRNFLPAAEFEALRAEALDFVGDAREMLQGDTITRRIALGPAALKAMPAVRGLFANKSWRGLVRYVGSFNSEPIHYIQTILSRINDSEPDPQTRLHADTFHATVKAWLFLTDVAGDEGPFVYVPGSHRKDAARRRWERDRSLVARGGLDRLSSRGSFRIDETELADIGLPAPRSFAVPANTLVVADTSGFHARGPSVRASMRIEIWSYGRRNPFLPWVGLDALSLPGIAERRASWVWTVRDRFERHLGQPWRKVGPKTARSAVEVPQTTIS